MAESVEITEYQYYTFSSRDKSYAHTVVLLFRAEGYFGAVFFSTDDAPLKPAEKHPTGIYSLYYRYVDLPILIDMLRNEGPVYLHYDPTYSVNCRLSTTPEPVGEGEESA